MTSTEDDDSIIGRQYVWPSSLSLLSVRRPSLAGLPTDSLSSQPASRMPSITRFDEFQNSDPANMRYLPDTEPNETDVSDLTQGLEIKMQGWVGEGVGKMSISPSGRDVVLATRSGLYVIDLEMPLELPRFIPQGGTWDVADVQWNPHPSRGNLVVSTSSEKLLIWNLDRADRSAIQHILSKHYRSITDVNWHNHHPDVVTSTGIDSWIWVWDLRTAVKPVTGLCAFNPGATQVKWNRQDENILASSHGNTLLIWDQRKGAVPLAIVKAHSSRIYGIDWSRTNQNEIATCSLDCTVKFWHEVNLGWSYSPSIMPLGGSLPISSPLPVTQSAKVIHTGYPVWRSRYIPFGGGVLSLPQRGFQKPELLRFVVNDSEEFTYKSINLIPEGIPGEGTVKEYAWRVKGGFNPSFDDREFQLVTWNEDRTIRAWPVSSSTLEEAGFIRGGTINDSSHRPSKKYISYRNVSEISSLKLCDYSVLDGIKTSRPGITEFDLQKDATTTLSRPFLKPGTGTATIKRGGTMTKGPCKVKNKPFSGLHALTWMPSVKTVGRGRNAPNVTRSRVTESSQHDYENLESSMASLASFKFGDAWTKVNEDNSDTQPQCIDDRMSDFEAEPTPTWAEELTSAVSGLTLSKTVKISLEKVWLKRRMCRLGLQGPWGENASIFVRVTFTFPKDYPHFPPQIDLEKNHLIPLKRRAMLLRELRMLGERPPCIEPCLRLLLGLPVGKGGFSRKAADMDSESSSDDETRAISSKGKDAMSFGQGFAEPRTSQGVFSPNGQLVVFSHVPVRIVKNATRNVSASPSASSRVDRQNGSKPTDGLSDALRRLTAVAQDPKDIPTIVGMDESLLRALELFSYPKLYNVFGSTASNDARKGYLVKPVRRSFVSIRDLADVTGLDKNVAKSYIVSGADPMSFCLRNANIAQSLDRTDHERIFRTLATLLVTNPAVNDLPQTYKNWRHDHLSRTIISSFLLELAESKDVLMLAMVSIALLSSDRMQVDAPLKIVRHLAHTSVLPGKSDISRSRQQYRASSGASSIVSQPSFGRPTASPVTLGLPNAPPSHSSSRSTWMGIANGVRYLVGSQNGQLTPKAHGSPIERSKTLPIVQEGNASSLKNLDSKHHAGNTQRNSPRFSMSFSLGNHEKEANFENISGRPTRGKRLTAQVSLVDGLVHSISEEQLTIYVLVFAEILYRWGLKQRRVELLGCLPTKAAKFAGSVDVKSDSLSIVGSCSYWNINVSPRQFQQRPLCTICRLPVNGLSHICLRCSHVSHLSCWSLKKQLECPMGCGCDCDYRGTFETKSADMRNVR